VGANCFKVIMRCGEASELLPWAPKKRYCRNAEGFAEPLSTARLGD